MPCEDCIIAAYTKGMVLREKVPVLAKLTATVFSVLPNRDTLHRSRILSFCAAVSDLVYFATQTCTAYFQKCDEHILVSSQQLHDSFRTLDGEDIWKGSGVTADDLNKLTALQTGCLFPSRKQCRPRIGFRDASDVRGFCNKNYKKSDTHSQGLRKVQCVCKHPKIMGIVVLTRNETTAISLSSFLSFFVVPPRNMYYENGCNLRGGIVTRLPFVFHFLHVLVDRFHFKSHTCSPLFDPAAYPELLYERTSTAESINAILAQTRRHFRFLRGSNVILFLRARMAIINLTYYIRSTETISDIEDQNLVSFFDNFIPCCCGRPLCSNTSQSHSTDGQPLSNAMGQQDSEVSWPQSTHSSPNSVSQPVLAVEEGGSITTTSTTSVSDGETP